MADSFSATNDSFSFCNSSFVKPAKDDGDFGLFGLFPKLDGDFGKEFLDLPDFPDLACPGMGIEHGVRSDSFPWLFSQAAWNGKVLEDSAPPTPLKISWSRS